jgi:hypothetical protein
MDDGPYHCRSARVRDRLACIPCRHIILYIEGASGKERERLGQWMIHTRVGGNKRVMCLQLWQEKQVRSNALDGGECGKCTMSFSCHLSCHA